MSLTLSFGALFFKRSPHCNLSLAQKCFLNSTATCLSKSREARFLGKLMGKASKKRRAWKPEVFSSSNTVGNIAQRSVGKQHLQRMTVLNNLFMEHITDFLGTSEAFKIVDGFNIEISEVKMAVDLNFLNVYWSSTCSKDHAIIEALLQEAAFPLRHELSKLNLIGNVPRIVFIRNTKNEHLSEIDRLLKIADYGEDFVPTNPTLFVDREFPKSVEAQTDVEVTEEEKKLAESRVLELRQAEVDQLVSSQKHTVFGLDQLSMMNRIKASLYKSKALHRQSATYGEVPVESEIDNNIDLITQRIEAIKSSDLKEFLDRRKKAILKDRRKMAKELNQRPEYKIYEADIEERVKKEFADDGSNYDYRDHR